MFRRYCKIGLIIIGTGVGMLFGCLLRLSAICVICGIALIITGVIFLRR